MSKQKPNNPKFWALQSIHTDNGKTFEALSKQYDITPELWERMQQAGKDFINSIDKIIKQEVN